MQYENTARVTGTLRDVREDKYAVTALLEQPHARKGTQLVAVRIWKTDQKKEFKELALGTSLTITGSISSRIFNDKAYTDFECNTMAINSDASETTTPVDATAVPF